MRYQTVREMIERLDDREDGIVPVQCPITFSKRLMRLPIRFVDRYPVLFMAMLGVFVVGMVAGVAFGVWRLV
jgi:hypothetical protein